MVVLLGYASRPKSFGRQFSKLCAKNFLWQAPVCTPASEINGAIVLSYNKSSNIHLLSRVQYWFSINPCIISVAGLEKSSFCNHMKRSRSFATHWYVLPYFLSFIVFTAPSKYGNTKNLMTKDVCNMYWFSLTGWHVQ